MSTIFVDRSVAHGSDVADRLVHLVESGHDLVLVAAEDDPARTLAAWSRRTDALPDDLPGGSWYLTADPATCGDQRAGLRTILIGARDDGPRPTRCDSTARDLRDAVLVVLTADAMG